MFMDACKLGRVGARVFVVMVFCGTLSAITQTAEAASVVVRLTGFANDDGQVQCGLFDKEDGWRDETMALKMTTSRIEATRAMCQFDQVDAGQYAVAAFHAQKNERQVRYGLFGKPQQGVGFSNNPSITWGPPSFDEAAFKVEGDVVSLDVQMKY